jgi:hypothetical protein
MQSAETGLHRLNSLLTGKITGNFPEFSQSETVLLVAKPRAAAGF